MEKSDIFVVDEDESIAEESRAAFTLSPHSSSSSMTSPGPKSLADRSEKTSLFRKPTAHNPMDDYVFPVDRLREENPNMTNVVIVACGSFSPITNMHLRMFETARDSLSHDAGLNVIGGYLSPVHDEYNKIGLVGSEHRKYMCAIATADSSWIMVDDWETRQASYTRTLFVLRHLKEALIRAERPNTRILLLCGGDLLESFTHSGVWSEAQVEEILCDHGVAVIERQGTDSRRIVQENDLLFRCTRNIYIIPEWILNDVSSTKIRRNIRRGLSIKYLVPSAVEDYIYEARLFGSQEQMPWLRPND